MSSQDDRVSVVMITHNRGAQIRIALEHLLELPERPRLIIVDNSSSDGTAYIAHAVDPRIEVIPLSQNIGGAGRNIGVSKTETPYVAFSDDDSWWQPGALRGAADLFDAHPSLGLIAARILVGPEERFDSLCHAMATSPLIHSCPNNCEVVGIPIVGFAACGAVVRRAAFLEAGGFDPHFGVGGEEQVFALDLLRRGWRLAYMDDIVAYHYPSPVRDLAKRQRHEIRNILWSAWLRRPAVPMWRVTWRIVKLSLRNEAHRAGLREAILGLPWVLSARNPVPAAVDRQLQIAEEAWIARSSNA